MKIKIVYLIGQMGLGGSERQLYLLLKHMDKTRFEPHIVIFNPSDHFTFDEDLRARGVEVHNIPLDLRSVVTRAAWLLNLFLRLRPRIVHSWTIHDNPYAGVIGWLAGIKTRWGSMRDALNSKNFLALPAFYQWLSLFSVEKITVNADSIREEILARRVAPARVVVLPNCVEPPAETSAPGWLQRLPADARIIASVGNLRRKKNHALFISALAEVLPRHPNVHGVVIGQPVPQEPNTPRELEEQIGALNMQERIHLVGFQENAAALMPRFEVFCLASDYEGTPNAVLEAMAAGCAVIATRVGGLVHLIEDGKNGLLIERGDANALTRALDSLLADSSYAAALGAQARADVLSRFSQEAILAKWEDLYAEEVK
ncbi:MAG: glycosyltransferase [Anaerolineales bacterium]